MGRRCRFGDVAGDLRRRDPFGHHRKRFGRIVAGLHTADESGVVTTGNMNYRPNGCVHSVTTQNGATVLAVVWGRTEPV